MDTNVFMLSSSNSSSLLFAHTKFVAENKPRFPHTDVARKMEYIQKGSGFDSVPWAGPRAGPE